MYPLDGTMMRGELKSVEDNAGEAAAFPGPVLQARFADLYSGFGHGTAVVEANRCLNCFDAPCMGACPTHIDVPRFIRKIASGNLTGSARTILEANVLGASCARACPVEILCEGACVMHQKNEPPIRIGLLQRYAMESYYDAGGKLPLRCREERRERVACIGAGPASLACAAELRQQGFQVTVMDRHPLPGGLNTYGVAEYKLRSAESVREAQMILDLGVKFEVREVDATALKAIEREFDAMFLGVGLGTLDRRFTDDGSAAGVVDALDFIASYKTGERVAAPARVVVIGGGNTAIDAARAAKRLGAQSVKVLYRRRREDMRAFDGEYGHALSEGVKFLWSVQPVRASETAAGLLLECGGVEADAGGSLAPALGAKFVIECDLVIQAIGQSPLPELLAGIRGVEMQDGRVRIDRATGQTANAKYFAGGDCVNGGRGVVDAVADGRRAAMGIAAWLDGRGTVAGG